MFTLRVTLKSPTSTAEDAAVPAVETPVAAGGAP
jgi:hypothetical protein